MRRVTVYTDGACSGNPGPGGWGAVLMYQKSDGTLAIKEISGGEANTTNNRMELMAVIQAISVLKEACEVEISSDSQYVVDAISNGWLNKWRASGWRTSGGSACKNVDLWEEYLTLARQHRVKFRKVKAHAGDEYNERCDELARNAIVR